MGNNRLNMPFSTWDGAHGARLLRFGVEVLLLLLVIGQVSCLVVLHSVEGSESESRGLVVMHGMHGWQSEPTDGSRGG